MSQYSHRHEVRIDLDQMVDLSLTQVDDLPQHWSAPDLDQGEGVGLQAAYLHEVRHY